MTLEELRRYYKNRRKVPAMVFSTIDSKEIIHGSKALDKQVPKQYRTYKYQDYDVFSKKPLVSAKETERFLEKQLGGDYYKVKAGRHEGTYKVVSKVTGQTIADFTYPPQKIKYKIIRGKKYRTLQDLKKHAQQTIRSKTATHRVNKDRDMINRIRLANLKKARSVLRKKRKPTKRKKKTKLNYVGKMKW